MDEFGLIGKIREAFPAPEGVRGIGDDCAVIGQQEGYDTLVSTDMLVEGVHFLIDDVTPWQLGWKAAAVNFSDIAAMGGYPSGSFLAFSLPERLRGKWTDEFMRGYRDISEKYGFPLLGGDTTASDDKLSICVTVLGRALKGRSKLRSTARPGDLICVTGTLGDSAGGLAVILGGRERDDDERWLVSRHYLPTPRMMEGQALAANEGVHAMMDISDGIGSDIRHIMDESGVGAVIDVHSIPHSDQLLRVCRKRGLDLDDLSISGGEDYELLFTADAAALESIDITCHVIGRITQEKRLEWKGADRDFKGFRHF